MPVVLLIFVIGAAMFSGFHEVVEPPREELLVAPANLPAVSMHPPVVPASALNNHNVIKQSFDYSCGSAALATVLNYQLGESFTERQVIAGLMRYGDKDAIAGRRAFSLLDMKRFVDTLGYRGVGYTAAIEDLTTLGRPCIIPVTVFDYRHFVVFKGIHAGHVFVADPFWGNTSYTVADFEAHWYRNAIFVVYPRKEEFELHALQLKAEDLRFIDEDSARDIIFNHDTGWDQAREWEAEKLFPATNKVQSKYFGGYRTVELPESTTDTP